MGIGAFIYKNFVPTITFSDKSKSVVKGTSNFSQTLPSSTFISTGTPVWKNFGELIYLLDCYYSNPVVQAIINIKAEAFANMRFKVIDLKSGETTPLEEYEGDNGDLATLLAQPNPLQSTKEWLKQNKVNYEVFGDSYMYSSIPLGYEQVFDYTDISVINNLPSYNVATTLTGNWLDAATKEEIIKNFVLTGFNGKKRELHPNTVLHLNNVNIKFDENFNKGKSDLLALKMPISNIEKAYESRNVLITKRGALGLLSSDKKDDVMGALPLEDDEIKEVQDAFKKYGLMNDQYSQIISPVPLKYQKMAQSVKDLMLFEEIEADAIAIAVAKGVPELLVKYYIKGGTFNNLDASEKRLYDSTIIPESEDFMQAFNKFLKLKESGIQLIGSYDHLKVLQRNQKEEAQTNREKEKTALSAFKIGATKYNDYLIAIGMPTDDEIGEKRIWDLTPEQLSAMGINSKNKKNEG